jgi:hypothetical protein
MISRSSSVKNADPLAAKVSQTGSATNAVANPKNIFCHEGNG